MILDTLAAHLAREQARKDDAEIRHMLGQWVSEFEPSVAYGPNGVLMGLIVADIPVGAYADIVIEPYVNDIAP